MSMAASSGEYIKKKKRLDCQEARFDLEEMKESSYGWEHGCGCQPVILSPKRRKMCLILKSSCFPVFTGRGFFQVCTLGTTAVEYLMEYKARSGHCGSSVPTGLFNRLLTSSWSAEFQVNSTPRSFASFSRENSRLTLQIQRGGAEGGEGHGQQEQVILQTSRFHGGIAGAGSRWQQNTDCSPRAGKYGKGTRDKAFYFLWLFELIISFESTRLLFC